jgi:hypothetical protein
VADAWCPQVHADPVLGQALWREAEKAQRMPHRSQVTASACDVAQTITPGGAPYPRPRHTRLLPVSSRSPSLIRILGLQGFADDLGDVAVSE